MVQQSPANLFVFVNQTVKGPGHRGVFRAQKFSVLVARFPRKVQCLSMQKLGILYGLVDVHDFTSTIRFG